MRLVQRLISARGMSIPAPEPESPDIVLKVVTSAANQKIGINKYFDVSDYTIDWGDGTTTTATTYSSSGAHSKTYATAGTYYITLVNPGSRWTFDSRDISLVPTSGFTGASVGVEYMPSLKDWFGNGASNPGDNFFRHFNYSGALTSLPSGSFDTSNIASASYYFFSNFNSSGALPKVSAGTGVSIKNVSSSNVVFHYAPSNSSDSISAGNTFDGYAKS